MAAGPPDRVDYARLAQEAAIVERDYAMSELPRLRELLDAEDGTLHARFEFIELDAERRGARIAIRATPRLVCQRCLQGFDMPLDVVTDVEFVAPGEEAMATAVLGEADGSDEADDAGATLNGAEAARTEAGATRSEAGATRTEAGATREPYEAASALVSLRDMAEEELLLAIPFAPACATPKSCENASRISRVDAPGDGGGEMRRPFAALQDLLKKT